LRKDFSPIPLDEMPVAAIRHKLETIGLQPNSVSMHGDFVFDDAVFERLVQLIPDVHRFGTRTLITNGPVQRADRGNAWDPVVSRTRELVSEAEKHDVLLAIEFEPNFVVGSTRDLLRLFDAVPSDHLAANLDLGHVFLCDPDPLQAIRDVGEKIVHCHIEDMPRGTHDHRVPGEGDMDLPAFLRTLREVGFDGGMALDLYAYDYEAVAGQSLAVLREFLSRL
jgi:sugar phosphate isomerase/epimerase